MESSLTGNDHRSGGSHSPGIEGLNQRFRTLRQLANHWARPEAPRAYYWYLTFENSPHLQSFVERCQKEISFPYYDFVSPSDLHLTIDRVAFEGDVTSDQLRIIQETAMSACSDIPSFNMAVSSLGGTAGAIGFSASPQESIAHLRDVLRKVTLSVYPGAPIKDVEFLPHITIAYCNSAGVSAMQVVAAVERIDALSCGSIAVKESSLVLLERRQRAYAWQEAFRIPLSGS